MGCVYVGYGMLYAGCVYVCHNVVFGMLECLLEHRFFKLENIESLNTLIYLYLNMPALAVSALT